MLTDGTLLLITSICTVELIIAAFMDGEADRPAQRVACFLHAAHPTEEVPSRAATAPLLIQARFRTVPVPITALLLGVTSSHRSPTKPFPREAVICDPIGCVKAPPFRRRQRMVDQGKKASVGFHLYCFVIGHIVDLKQEVN